METFKHRKNRKINDILMNVPGFFRDVPYFYFDSYWHFNEVLIIFRNITDIVYV